MNEQQSPKDQDGAPTGADDAGALIIEGASSWDHAGEVLDAVRTLAADGQHRSIPLLLREPLLDDNWRDEARLLLANAYEELGRIGMARRIHFDLARDGGGGEGVVEFESRITNSLEAARARLPRWRWLFLGFLLLAVSATVLASVVPGSILAELAEVLIGLNRKVIAEQALPLLGVGAAVGLLGAVLVFRVVLLRLQWSRRRAGSYAPWPRYFAGSPCAVCGLTRAGVGSCIHCGDGSPLAFWMNKKGTLAQSKRRAPVMPESSAGIGCEPEHVQVGEHAGEPPGGQFHEPSGPATTIAHHQSPADSKSVYVAGRLIRSRLDWLLRKVRSYSSWHELLAGSACPYCGQSSGIIGRCPYCGDAHPRSIRATPRQKAVLVLMGVCFFLIPGPSFATRVLLGALVLAATTARPSSNKPLGLKLWKLSMTVAALIALTVWIARSGIAARRTPQPKHVEYTRTESTSVSTDVVARARDALQTQLGVILDTLNAKGVAYPEPESSYGFGYAMGASVVPKLGGESRSEMFSSLSKEDDRALASHAKNSHNVAQMNGWDQAYSEGWVDGFRLRTPRYAPAPMLYQYLLERYLQYELSSSGKGMGGLVGEEIQVASAKADTYWVVPDPQKPKEIIGLALLVGADQSGKAIAVFDAKLRFCGAYDPHWSTPPPWVVEEVGDWRGGTRLLAKGIQSRSAPAAASLDNGDRPEKAGAKVSPSLEKVIHAYDHSQSVSVSTFNDACDDAWRWERDSLQSLKFLVPTFQDLTLRTQIAAQMSLALAHVNLDAPNSDREGVLAELKRTRAAALDRFVQGIAEYWSVVISARDRAVLRDAMEAVFQGYDETYRTQLQKCGLKE